jgi:hypothetical protein
MIRKSSGKARSENVHASRKESSFHCFAGASVVVVEAAGVAVGPDAIPGPAGAGGPRNFNCGAGKFNFTGSAFK